MTQTWQDQARRRADKAACASSAIYGGGPAGYGHRRFRGRWRFLGLRWRLFSAR